MLHDRHNPVKTIKVNGIYHYVMMLPILSVSRPNNNGICRIIFDWGKSLAHPCAMIAFAIMRYNQHIERLIFNNNEYVIYSVDKCRSGRLAMYASKVGAAQEYDINIISLFMNSEQ